MEIAERIFVDRCEAASTLKLHGLICTRYEFAVDEMLKGEKADRIVVNLQGGRSKESDFRLVGMPVFLPRERIVLFLTVPDAAGNPWPVGLAQGKFRIESDPSHNGEPGVYQSLPGLFLYTSETGSGSAKASNPNGDGHPLTEFLSSIRRLAGSESPSQAGMLADRYFRSASLAAAATLALAATWAEGFLIQTIEGRSGYLQLTWASERIAFSLDAGGTRDLAHPARTESCARLSRCGRKSRRRASGSRTAA